MSIRPRRSAAQRANLAITDMADRDRDVSEQRTMSSRNPRRSGNGIASVSRGMPSSSPASSAGDGNQHIHLTVKLPSSKLRQATSSTNTGKRRPSGTVTAGASKRTRGGKKSYVIESSEDEEEEEEEEEDEEEDEDEEDEEDEVEEDEIEVGNRAGFAKAASEEDEEEEVEEEDEQMEDLGDDDADGDDDGDEMDVDADGDDDEDADADGDVDMDVTPAPRAPAIKITKPPKSTATPSKSKSASTTKPVAKGTAVIKTAAQDDDDDDDDDEELSELESEPEDVTVEVAQGDEDAEGDDDEDVDAEGEEEIEVADEDGEGEDEELGSDDDGSRAGTPDLSKLTARQRAKLGDASHEYLKLSDGETSASYRPSKQTANHTHRGSSKEALHRRRTVDASPRDGPPQTQSQRQAQ